MIKVKEDRPQNGPKLVTILNTCPHRAHNRATQTNTAHGSYYHSTIEVDHFITSPVPSFTFHSLLVLSPQMASTTNPFRKKIPPFATKTAPYR